METRQEVNVTQALVRPVVWKRRLRNVLSPASTDERCHGVCGEPPNISNIVSSLTNQMYTEKTPPETHPGVQRLAITINHHSCRAVECVTAAWLVERVPRSRRTRETPMIGRALEEPILALNFEHSAGKHLIDRAGAGGICYTCRLWYAGDYGH